MAIKIVYKKIEKNCQNRILTMRYSLEYNLIGSILKKHFKELMLLGRLQTVNKTGYILKGNESKFEMLVDKINSADDDKCKKSHDKAKDKKCLKKLLEKKKLTECPDCCEKISGNRSHKCWESGLIY